MRDRIVLLVAIIIVGLLVWQLGPILTPFVIGAALAYLCDPLVDRLERWGVKRTIGVSIVFLVVAVVLVVLVVVLAPILHQQIIDFIHNIPSYINWVRKNVAPMIGSIAGDQKLFDPASLKSFIKSNWSSYSDVIAATLKQVFSSGSALLQLVLNLLLVPVILFYLLRDWDRMVAWISDQLPRRHVGRIGNLARETDRVLGQFLRGQLSVMAVLGAIYVVGLWLAGVHLALVIGIIAGLVSFVPYLGVIVGLLLSSIAVLVQTGELFPLIWVGIIFAFGQMMEQMVLQPLLVGDAIGLHPVWVIFAVLAGGQLFGFIGVLLALPVSAAISVFVRFGGELWRGSALYLDES